MASVKYGAFITDMKGKIGGTVFQGGLSGQTSKLTKADAGRSKLTKADAGRVINVLPITAQVSGLWRGLTDAERDSWATGAVNYPAVNKFGTVYTPSGYQVFMTLNFQLKALATSVTNTCPVPITINPPPTFTITQPSLTSILLAFAVGIQTDVFIRVEATQPMSFGNKPKNSFFKAIAQLPDSTTTGYQMFSDYANVYGSFPINAKIYFRFTAISALTGQKGVPVVVELTTA